MRWRSGFHENAKEEDTSFKHFHRIGSSKTVKWREVKLKRERERLKSDGLATDPNFIEEKMF